MSSPEKPMRTDSSIERLDFGDAQPYEAVEAAIHLNRYMLAQRFCAGRKVLDVACGQGYGAYLMAERWGAQSVVAVDNSAQALKAAVRDFKSDRVEYRELDAHHLATHLPASQFDLVVSLETFEHLRNPESFLAGISHVLADGGIVIISCPNDHWYYRTPQESNPFHVRKYKLDEFKTITESKLGPGSFVLGAPVSGFMNLIADGLTGVEGTPKLMLSARNLTDATVVPTETTITSENCRYFVGIWGALVAGPLSATIYPTSMDANQEAHRALQVENLRDEVISLRTASHEVRQLRARVAELESARTTLDHELTEARGLLAGGAGAYAVKIAELERQSRHAGLKVAALRAEQEYLREEFARVHWPMEQELGTARTALATAQAELESARSQLQRTQAELAELHEKFWWLERTLTFRIRRFGGRVVRRLGLRKPRSIGA